jgi:hypothetical protein
MSEVAHRNWGQLRFCYLKYQRDLTMKNCVEAVCNCHGTVCTLLVGFRSFLHFRKSELLGVPQEPDTGWDHYGIHK